jgi:hypothetical protein
MSDREYDTDYDYEDETRSDFDSDHDSLPDFDKLSINDYVSRSAMNKIQRDSGLNICTSCLKQFSTINKLRKHLKKKRHFADKEEIKQDYQEAKEHYFYTKNDPSSTELNKKLAFGSYYHACEKIACLLRIF